MKQVGKEDKLKSDTYIPRRCPSNILYIYSYVCMYQARVFQVNGASDVIDHVFLSKPIKLRSLGVDRHITNILHLFGI